MNMQDRRKRDRGPKGRPLDGGALAEVRALLGKRERRRDLLIEHLHLLQDHFGHLSSAHLAALAEEMRLAQTEVFEVATFYAHFDVVKEGEAAPPALTVRVCDSLSCAMAGAEQLLRDLPARLGRNVRVVRAPCMGACDRAPVCAVGHAQLMHATLEGVADGVTRGGHPAGQRPQLHEALGQRLVEGVAGVVGGHAVVVQAGLGAPAGDHRASTVQGEPDLARHVALGVVDERVEGVLQR